MKRLLPLLLAVACATSPFAPPAAVPWMPPTALIDSLWYRAEVCAQTTQDQFRITWYIVPTAGFDSPNGDVRGLWVSPHTIYLAEPQPDRYDPDPYVILHEMLHDLLQTGDHPAAFDRCAVR